jgi:hypothetical protein
MHNLPIEIVEQIISLLNSHTDLLSLALVSRAFLSLIIPKQIEYRELCIGPKTPHVIWTHLARRADLTCNIRSVVFQTNAYGSPRFRHPVTLVEKDDAVGISDVDLTDVICKALQNMHRMEYFFWNNFAMRTSISTQSDVKILTSLSHCLSLRHLELVGDIGSFPDYKESQITVVRGIDYIWGK